MCVCVCQGWVGVRALRRAPPNARLSLPAHICGGRRSEKNTGTHRLSPKSETLTVKPRTSLLLLLSSRLAGCRVVGWCVWCVWVRARVCERGRRACWSQSKSPRCMRSHVAPPSPRTPTPPHPLPVRPPPQPEDAAAAWLQPVPHDEPDLPAVPRGDGLAPGDRGACSSIVV